MAYSWIKAKTPGIRFREHPTRKHGVKPDKYFVVRYKMDGKDREEALGWSSEGWTEAKSAAVLADLKKAQVTGCGAKTLAESRAVDEERRLAEEQARKEQERGLITVAEFFRETYFPQAQMDKKPRTCDQERYLFNLWIEPVIGKKPVRSVTPFDMERIKKLMAEAGRAPRSIQYALAVTRQIFNHARRAGLWQGDSPTVQVKKPKVDNGRLRFLTREEADSLLDLLKKRSRDTHDAALISLHCGLRMGEILALKWCDVDLDRGLLSLRDAKAGTRTAFLTPQAAEVLAARGPGKPPELVFPGKTGLVADRVSPTFKRTVKALGLNDGIEDPRQKVVFHTLRHTFASWLVESGTDLYTVQRLLGHKTGVMTQRYAHLSPDTLRNAVRTFGENLSADPLPRNISAI